MNDPSFLFPKGCEEKVKKGGRRGRKVKEMENPKSNELKSQGPYMA